MMNIKSESSKWCMKTFKGIAVLFGMVALLTACGGGGGGSDGGGSSSSSGSSNSTPVAPLSPEAEEEDDTPIDVNSTAELVVPEGFVFSRNDGLNVVIETTDDAYVSICNAESGRVDYNDCLMRTWVRVDEFQATLNIPQHVSVLAASVLVPDVSTEPAVYEWRRDNGMQWRLKL